MIRQRPCVVRVRCTCRRLLCEFTVEGLPDRVLLRPTLRSLAQGFEPAGPKGLREEYRWRVRCPSDRCKTELVLNGEKLAARVLAAHRAGRFRQIGDGRLRGRARADARVVVEAGIVDSWKEAARKVPTRVEVLDLVVGDDL